MQDRSPARIDPSIDHSLKIILHSTETTISEQTLVQVIEEVALCVEKSPEA